MKKFLFFVLFALGVLCAPARAQQASSALILSACGTLPAGVTYAAGQYGIQTIDTTGKSCSGATFSGSVSAVTAATSQSTLPTLTPSAGSPVFESLGGALYNQPVFGSASGGGTQVDATHGLPVNCIVGCAAGTGANNADSVAAVSTGLGATQTYPFLWNGTNFDRWYGDETNGAFVNVKTSVIPTGAATSANQTTANSSLADIDANTRAAIPDCGSLPCTNKLGALAPLTATSTQTKVTITTAGTYQQYLASNTARKGCTIQFITASHTGYVFFGAAPGDTTTSFQLAPGQTLNCGVGTTVLTDAIQLTSSNDSDVFVVNSY